MLLVWANALVFARVNGLEMGTSAWWGIHWGSIIRSEKKKRFYHGYFKETPLITKCIFTLHQFFWKVKKNPSLAVLPAVEQAAKTLFLFDKAITHEQLFMPLNAHRDFIKEQLYNLLQADKKAQLVSYPIPAIAVHIRRGDFKLANQTTDLSFFISAIELVRHTKKSIVPVTIFTDAGKEELQEILALPQTSLAAEKADILDILLMSQSSIIILSQSSTFSYWAAFLSDAFVIMPHNDWQEGIKPNGENYREVKWNKDNPEDVALLQNLLMKGNLKAV